MMHCKLNDREEDASERALSEAKEEEYTYTTIHSDLEAGLVYDFQLRPRGTRVLEINMTASDVCVRGVLSCVLGAMRFSVLTN